jgi:hypothetical protein
LRVEVAPDQHLGVIEARGEHTDPHFAPAGGGQGSVDHLQPLGITEAADSNNTIARLHHGRSPCNRVIYRKDRHSSAAALRTASSPSRREL